jgi:hypothetical protein
LNLLQLETSKKGCQANLRWSIGGLPKVEFACTVPLLDLSRDSRFREAVVVERDHINLRATAGTPRRNCSCAPNDQRSFSLEGDPGCFRHHRSLHFVDLGCIPCPNARMLLEWRIKSPQKRPKKFSKCSQRLVSKEKEGVMYGLLDLAAS